jgi:polyhydroxyalkanoate synthesis regulator protein
MIKITQHKNHKLYVPALSRYTNLKEIKALVQSGEKVQVVNHNNEDVTAHILAQVLTMTRNVPVGRLAELIQKGE